MRLFTARLIEACGQNNIKQDMGLERYERGVETWHAHSTNRLPETTAISCIVHKRALRGIAALRTLGPSRLAMVAMAGWCRPANLL